MGLFGMNALTAYFGVIAVGRGQKGGDAACSGAAGSVGAMAAQFGRILGCRVVGLCGSVEKARWLREGLRYYFSDRLCARGCFPAWRRFAPMGWMSVFDNVGGEFLHQALARTSRHGRSFFAARSPPMM